VAIVVGIHIKSIHNITTWIAFGLYGGYVAPNILKWHWWRFNGYGYFAGMIAGVVAALVPLLIVPDMNRIYILPFSLLISTIASIVVCLRTPPEKDEVLESFSPTRFSHPFTAQSFSAINSVTFPLYYLYRDNL